ncbi:hypothetical protein HMPREF3173_13025 [Pseudomonas sp. HMSC08G10]|nr:hypothetical protein HMPREF3173_13025 [Pseudomonas sp. HMSC08G10]
MIGIIKFRVYIMVIIFFVLPGTVRPIEVCSMSNERQAVQCDAKSVLTLALSNGGRNAMEWQLIILELKAAEGTKP